MDPGLTGSQLLLSSLLQNTVRGCGGPDGLILQTQGPYDFYRDPNMCQARLCLPAVEQLSRAVAQRLEEWPEHPALIQVVEIIIIITSGFETASENTSSSALVIRLLCFGHQIAVVIERILGFGLSSPLAKFLNGLEILLTKAQVRSGNFTWSS